MEQMHQARQTEHQKETRKQRGHEQQKGGALGVNQQLSVTIPCAKIAARKLKM